MRFYELPQNLDDEINQYEQVVNEYLSGIIPKVKIKAFRVPFGVYEQRQNETYMMRIRLPGGAITPEQLLKVAHIAEKYASPFLHFTTRQDVQIHNLNLEDTVLAMKELKKAGLSSRGGGGNTIRNILGSYDTGIDDADIFDISPYVQALTTRMISEPVSCKVPRKMKIAFSGNFRDRGLATVNDLGFIAMKNEKKEKGFSVYIAGGMGRKARIGFLLYDFIHHTEVYNIAKAAKRMFDKYGNRKNKYKARLRFLLEKVGKKEFIRLFKEEYAAVKRQNFDPLELPVIQEVKKGWIKIPLFLGDMASDKATVLAEITGKYGEDTIRITPEQNILIRNINEKEKAEIEKELDVSGFLPAIPGFIGDAIACAGASTCRLGVCLSRNLLEAIKVKCADTSFNTIKINDISIKISGCPNTCGHHSIADIGFYGIARRCYGRLAPFYHMVAGGIVKQGESRFAENIGILPAKNIPALLNDFFQFVIKTRNENEEFSCYFKRAGKQKLVQLAAQYLEIPSFDEDQSYYYDWSDTNPFSLADKSVGECSAGLFDLIDLDLSMAQNVLLQTSILSDATHISKEIHQAILYTTRSLLITKGLEPKGDKEAVVFFQKYFIGTHIERSWGSVIEKFLADEEISLDEAQGLFKAVKILYHSMDDSLRFPDFDNHESNKKMKELVEFHDFRGVACPLNFVKTKLVLEKLHPGDIIEILLDDGEPVENVPVSIKEEGHKIKEQKSINGYWSIIIEKGKK